MINNFPVLVVIVPFISAIFTFAIGVIGNVENKKFCFFITILALLLAFLMSLFNLDSVMNSGTINYWLGNWDPPYGIEYVIDYLNAFVCIIVTFLGLMVAIYSKKWVEKDFPDKVVSFYTVYLLLMTGLIGIVVTGDIFNLYVFLEISSIAAYALIAIGKDRNALLAGYNYMIMGTIAACFVLLGIGYLYIVTGSLNMADLSKILPELYTSKVVLVAFAFFIIGLSIKIALFPLHTWLPDAYTYAPSPVSAIIAATMSKVGAYALIRILFTVFTPKFIIDYLPITNILAWIAAIAIIAGSVIALAQTDIKRMLAYSSVSQIGYIVLGISLANPYGIIGAILHILNHAFMKGALFLAAGAVEYKTGIRNINNFYGLALIKKMPLTVGAFTVAAFSMVGLPPFIGFWSKYYLILGSIAAQEWTFAIVILVSSLLNAAYFLRVLEKKYFEVKEEDKDLHKVILSPSHSSNHTLDDIPLTMLIPILILASGIIILFVFISVPLGIVEHIVNLLIGGI
ncbi:MAG TPA: monovalent cation/H+ antiporter subunit D family protein [Methanosarcinales archaeon]|nr:monovalent cation/H+ antiporter subunit D family protein [Methanosarcinales archaeon]